MKKQIILVVIIFFSVIFGWSEEKWARVIRQVDIPQQNGSIRTQIQLDRFDNGKNGRADMSMVLVNTAVFLY